MACDLKTSITTSIPRMCEKLHEIEKLAFLGQADADANDKLGGKYVVLSRAISKIAVQVRDTMSVRYYWYARFIAEGVLVPSGRGNEVAKVSAAEGRGSTVKEAR